MRISDLSKQTGLPVATIKFYLREQLLPPGTPTGRNQATYDEIHLRRLLLIRTFTNIAQLDLSSIRDLLAAIEDDNLPLPKLFQLVNRTVAPERPGANPPHGIDRARADVDALIDDLGWHVDVDATGRARLAQVVAALKSLGCECGISFFEPYAKAAEWLADHELDLLPVDDDGTQRGPAVVRNILFDTAMSAMRRMAYEHIVARRFHEKPTDPDDRNPADARHDRALPPGH